MTAPTLAPAGGAFSTPVQVTVATSTPSSVVRYSLDGAEATENSPQVVGESVEVGQSSTLRARAWRAGSLASDESGATFMLALASPANVTFTPAAGAYSPPLSVRLSTTSAGAVIRYTLDGTDPGPTSAVYQRPLELGESTTIRAVAMLPNHEPSATTSAAFAVTPAAARMPVLDSPSAPT